MRLNHIIKIHIYLNNFQVGSGLNLLMEMTVEVIEIGEEVGIDVEIGTEIHVEVVEGKNIVHMNMPMKL